MDALGDDELAECLRNDDVKSDINYNRTAAQSDSRYSSWRRAQYKKLAEYK